MLDCQDKIYSEEYEDYIVEYGNRPELVPEQYETECYQLVSSGSRLYILRERRWTATVGMQNWRFPDVLVF